MMDVPIKRGNWTQRHAQREDNMKTQRETTTQDWGTEVMHLETKKHPMLPEERHGIVHATEPSEGAWP